MASSPSSADQQTQQILRKLLQGLNDMQVRQGLSPSGVPIPPTSMPLQAQTPPPAYRPEPPDAFSRQLMTTHLEAQQMSRAVMPPPMMGSLTPVERMGSFNMPTLPPSIFGSPMGMGRQQAVADMNSRMGSMQAGASILNRGLGALSAGVLMGPLGAYNYEDSGQGQRDQDFGASLFNPLIANRTEALQLQRQSMNFVRGGADLSASGTGLSMTASQRLQSGLNTMADSRGFQQATGGMFNRQDVSKITSLAGQMGMLDQSQSADQIRQQVGRISRSLSNFMRIAEQPDMQEAMRSLSQMRQMGMGPAETTQAVRNAHSFARMAGTTTQAVMQQGMAGAGVFQQAGLSGAAGMQAGMASAGMAGSMASLMDPRALSRAGGAEGIAGTLTTGAAQAGISPMFMASMLTRRGGHLAIDRQAMSRMMRGDMSIQQVTQQGAERIQRLGGREALMELSTRQGELQDQAQGMMGGQMSALMPFIQARAIQRGTPGMSLGGAFRTMGMGETQARTYEQMAQSPQFWENMRRQQRQDLSEQRREVSQVRAERAADAGYGGFSRSVTRHMDSLVERVGGGADRAQRSLFGAGQDIEEAREAAGGGRLLRGDAGRDFSTDAGRRALRRELRTAGGTESFYRRLSVRQPRIQEAAAAEDRVAMGQEQQRGSAFSMTAAGAATGNPALFGAGLGTAVGGRVASAFMGPDGIGMPGTRGEFLRETVEANESLGTRIFQGSGLAAALGQTASTEQITARAQDMQRVGQLFEARGVETSQQRRATATSTRDAVRGAMGAGATPERARAVIGTASAAVNAMLEAHHTHLGPFGSDDAPVSTPQLQAAIRQSFIDSGMSEAEATRLASDPSTMRQVVGAGESSRSPEATAVVDHAVSAAGDISGVTAGRDAGELREEARTESRATLENLGVSTGFFSHTSDEAQEAILGVMAATGEGSQASRLILAQRAAAAAGNTDQASMLQQQIDELSTEEREAGEDIVSSAMPNIDTNDLRDIGGALAGQDETQIAATLAQAHEGARGAQDAAVGAAMIESMGSEAFAAAQEGSGALISLAQSGGEIRGASEEELEAMQTHSAEGHRAAEGYRARMAREGAAAAGGTSVETAGGRSTLGEGTEAGGLGEVIGDLEAGAMDGLMPGAEEAGGEGTAPTDFVGAVGTFSRASTNLLRAAEAFNQGAQLANLAGTAGAGDAPSIFSILFPGMGGLVGR